MRERTAGFRPFETILIQFLVITIPKLFIVSQDYLNSFF